MDPLITARSHSDHKHLLVIVVSVSNANRAVVVHNSPQTHVHVENIKASNNTIGTP